MSHVHRDDDIELSMNRHKKQKYKTLSLLSVLSSSIRVLVGPVTLLILAKKLTNEELGFYYTFFSLTAMVQLLEVGMTGVLKQYYSHSYDVVTDRKDDNLISNYFIFSLYWYTALSILFCALGMIVSYVMFKDYHGIIQWKGPWFLLLGVSCVGVLMLPLIAMLDGTQRQFLLIRSNIISQLIVAISLWGAITASYGLYAMGVSQLLGIISFLLSIYIFNNYSLDFIKLRARYFNFRSVFRELWPLLKKTSIVWFLGYFYWNGFNIIAFKYVGAELAGQIGISISVMRAGQNVAMSILNSQMTLYANNIAKGFVIDAKKIFDRYFYISLAFLLTGYLIFYIAYFIKPDIFLFKKMLPLDQIIYLTIFFVFTYIISGKEVFVRCFKVEKFVLTQTVNSILTPLLFFLAIYFNMKFFSLPIVSVFIVSILTIFISRRFYLRCQSEKDNLIYIKAVIVGVVSYWLSF